VAHSRVGAFQGIGTCKELKTLPPSSMCILSATLPNLFIPDLTSPRPLPIGFANLIRQAPVSNQVCSPEFDPRRFYPSFMVEENHRQCPATVAFHPYFMGECFFPSSVIPKCVMLLINLPSPLCNDGQSCGEIESRSLITPNIWISSGAAHKRKKITTQIV